MEKMTKTPIFDEIYLILTRIDLKAQKELESGQGVKKTRNSMNFQKKNTRVVKSHFSWTYGQKRVFRVFARAFFGKSCLGVFTQYSVKSGQKVKKITFSGNSSDFL